MRTITSKTNAKAFRSLAIVVAASAFLAEAGMIRLRGYRSGGNVIVRCRHGHLFTTIWIPGGSLKSIRLGWWRLQRCPVAGHWSLVTPVAKAGLSDVQLRSADENRDVRIP